MARPTVAECRELLAACAPGELDALIERLSGDDRAGVRALADAACRRRAAARAEGERLDGLLKLERSLSAGGTLVVAGVDEVGRGALAGPVTAAAVVLGDAPLPAGLNDSKRLTPARRSQMAALLRDGCRAWAVAHVSHEAVDAIGIARATRQAMQEALAALEVAADHVIVDGLPIGAHASETAVVKGDSRVACVAAASIVAKVARDDLMARLGERHPGWDFAVNKGYGTPEHLARVAEQGPCPVHRRSFLRNVIEPKLW